VVLWNIVTHASVYLLDYAGTELLTAILARRVTLERVVPQANFVQIVNVFLSLHIVVMEMLISVNNVVSQLYLVEMGSIATVAHVAHCLRRAMMETLIRASNVMSLV
jgi:hypothetical protein